MNRLSLRLYFQRMPTYVITAVITIIAIIIIWQLWLYYQVRPWTRDARLRADVVKVAPDIPGFVTKIYVRDNQPVQRGQELFMLDQKRFILALADAEAKVSNDQAALAESIREDARNRRLGNLVSKEVSQQTLSRTQQLHASLEQDIARRNIAKLNLARTVVRASVNGVVTNFELRPGNYLVTGEQAFAIVDTDTLRLEGYFEETKLPNIHIGDKAIIHLMGEKKVICGHVDSIASGITDRERNLSHNQLANINPTFNWVRLAQRIPVHIVLDKVPKEVRLISGRTATVKIIHQHYARTEPSC